MNHPEQVHNDPAHTEFPGLLQVKRFGANKLACTYVLKLYTPCCLCVLRRFHCQKCGGEGFTVAVLSLSLSLPLSFSGDPPLLNPLHHAPPLGMQEVEVGAHTHCPHTHTHLPTKPLAPSPPLSAGERGLP